MLLKIKSLNSMWNHSNQYRQHTYVFSSKKGQSLELELVSYTEKHDT